MATSAPSIFISYAPEDQPDTETANSMRWLSFVTEYLQPASPQGKIEM